MSKLSILIFGTNQYYEPPQEIITKFIKTHNVENFSQKRESSMSFSYQLTSSDPTEIKLVFLKNVEKLRQDDDFADVTVDENNNVIIGKKYPASKELLKIIKKITPFNEKDKVE